MSPRFISSQTLLRLCSWVVGCGVVLVLGCGAEKTGNELRGKSPSSAVTVPNASFPGAAAGASPAPSSGPSPSSGAPAVVNGAGGICASAVIHTTTTMPTIVFVIDGSGSMCAPFGMGTRWQALRSALLDPTKGLIYRLQNSVLFGATLYDGTIDSNLAATGLDSVIQNPPCALLYAAFGKDVGMCPQLLEALPPKLNNAQAIDMAYPSAELGGSTPTDRALDHVMNALIASRQQVGPDDPLQGNVYVILATDGAPNDICVNGTGGDGSPQRQAVVAAVDRGAAAGITTWVISLADGDPLLQTHLDEVAKHGDPKNAGAHTFSPMNPDELIMTLAQLLGGAIGCHIELNGKVMTGQECLGTVEQNSIALPCCMETSPGTLNCGGAPAATPNGWRLSDPHSIELLGSACADFLLASGTLLNAKFPCAIFAPD